mgnify:CR=1 FL=1
MDIGLVYSHDLKEIESHIPFESIDKVKIRMFTKSDLPKLIDITIESFEGYGHYFADIAFDLHPVCPGRVY